MARRTGSADLPFLGGRVPAWLGTRMASLGDVIWERLFDETKPPRLEVGTNE
jgi:uncharacterized protein